MDKNMFLSAYKKRIDEVVHELQSISLMSIPTGNIELSEVSNLLNGCKLEISKQEKKIEELNNNIDELIEENKKLNKVAFGNSNN